MHKTCRQCGGTRHPRQCRHSAAWRLAQFGVDAYECPYSLVIGYLSGQKIGDYADAGDAQRAEPVLRPPCDHEDNTNRLHRPCCGDRFICALTGMPVKGTYCAGCDDWERVKGAGMARTEAPVLAE